MAPPIPHPDFWRRFLAATDIADASSRLYGPTHADDSMAATDDAVQQILSGDKTASSALLAAIEAAGKEPPQAGSLGILLDEAGRSVAVLEWTEVSVERFSDVDDAFARAHGSGQSLKSWRRQCRSSFASVGRALGEPFGEDSRIVCFRFCVVYAPKTVLQNHDGDNPPD